MDTPTYLVHDRSSRINCTKESPSGLSNPCFRRERASKSGYGARTP